MEQLVGKHTSLRQASSVRPRNPSHPPCSCRSSCLLGKLGSQNKACKAVSCNCHFPPAFVYFGGKSQKETVEHLRFFGNTHVMCKRVPGFEKRLHRNPRTTQSLPQRKQIELTPPTLPWKMGASIILRGLPVVHANFCRSG